MPTRGRWLLGSLAALVVLLFAGQWVADFLADRWWAAALVPEAASFLSGIHLLRLTLDVAAVLVATAWYAGHLLIVHRAIGSVQISRQVANLEIREAVTPATLLPLAVGVGAALGVVAGLGAGKEWPVFALAWQGVTYGITDPYFHRDLGVFVAQLPLWVVLHDFARLLAWSALGAVALLYAALGAIRWQRGRPAMSDHARRHIGLLLAGGALVLAWGFLLDPFEVAAERAPALASWASVELSTLGLAGACLAAAAVSVLWAFRGQHLLMLAAWGVLLAGTALVRATTADAAAPASEDNFAIRASMDRIAYGVDAVDDRVARHQPEQGAGVPSLWTSASIGRMVTTDSQVIEAAARATVVVGGSSLPVWLAVRSAPGGPASVLAIADGWTGATSGPLSFRQDDSLAYPGFVTYANLGPSASRPGAARLVVDSGSLGPAAGGHMRRLVLAWALQSGRLLGPVSPAARVRWELAPRSRLERLAPFASWDSPFPIVNRGALSWVAQGYLASARFPGSSRIPEPTGELGSLEAGFIGLVDAATGATVIYLAPDAGPQSRSWSSITQGVVRPAAEIPPGIAGLLPYPARLFEAQMRVVEQEPWRAGSLAGRAPDGKGDPVPPTAVWAGGSGYELVAGYQSGEDRRVRTLLIGRISEGGSRLTLVRLGEEGSLPGPSTAQATWDRFPSFEQIKDSVVRQGERFERGPWRLLPRGEAPVAYQPWYAIAPSGRVTLPYVALAQGTQVGAGRSFADAWDNLRGTGAPLPPGFGPVTPFEEARRWMLRADSALHAGDWEAFGRAFGALRQSLGVGRPVP